ncbi:MAG: DUF2807 domain-containing protein [Bacteroidetes bacterium]|nr:DUF2807 domain-containing protein [Bacteroidota bacterium]MBL6963388.1 DUF2807 domain-containing protein [Bacteroidota bacterium]
MKKIVLLLSLITISFFSFGQTGDSNLVEDEIVQDMARESIPFTKLIIEGMDIEVILTQGDECAITYENSNQGERLTTEMKDEYLVLSAQPGFDGEVYVMFKELDYLEVKDIAEVSSTNTIYGDHFDLISSGTSEIDLQLNVNSLNTKIDGASEINLAGLADSFFLHITGAAELNAKELQIRRLVLNISGAGEAAVSVSEEISGDISGAAELSFYGDPKVDNIRVTGTAVFKGKGKKDVLTGSGKDTVIVKIGGYNLNITEDDDEHKKCAEEKCDEYKPWAGFGLGVNGYMNSSNQFDIPTDYVFLELNYAKSIGVELNLFEKDIPIIGEFVQLVSGLGFDFADYRFDQDTRLIDNNTSLSGYVDTINSYSKTKLTTSFLTLPILLEINTGSCPEKSVHISGGLLLGYKLGSKTKVVYIDNNEKKKIKEKGDYSLNPFRYGLTARIGYGKDMAIYANYALSELFEKNKGPVLYPFTVGIALLFN